jgi:hypothetical protein
MCDRDLARSIGAFLHRRGAMAQAAQHDRAAEYDRAA